MQIENEIKEKKSRCFILHPLISLRDTIDQKFHLGEEKFDEISI